MSNLSTSFKDDASILRQWSEMLEASVIRRPDWILILFLILMSVIFVGGVIGNLLTCVVIFFDKSMHTATNCYLFILAVSDLLVAFGIILEIFGYLEVFKDYENTLLYNRSVCKIHFFLVVTLFNNGILIMTALAIERYIAIYHPLLLNPKPVWRRVMKIIILIWTAAILETLPEIWTVDLIKTQSFRMCFPLPSTFARWLNSVLGVITFIIPLIIMTFVYTAIAFKVNMIPRKTSRDIIFNQRNNRSKINKLVGKLRC
ncbi:unnamed protein product [Diatraea saccharalis]|uniref:G-protein coupled receptors family 1 profile domain-containing protein n=1 Tax=Diatraea saccharalis TaxID=40085 RepID=A0A9N9QXF9_9NEOP|nr:unnamed protein product [Diatraea saccharalis]